MVVPLTLPSQGLKSTRSIYPAEACGIRSRSGAFEQFMRCDFTHASVHRPARWMRPWHWSLAGWGGSVGGDRERVERGLPPHRPWCPTAADARQENASCETGVITLVSRDPRQPFISPFLPGVRAGFGAPSRTTDRSRRSRRSAPSGRGSSASGGPGPTSITLREPSRIVTAVDRLSHEWLDVGVAAIAAPTSDGLGYLTQR